MDNGIVKVIIVDDHEIFRRGLIQYFRYIETAKIVGEAVNGEDFLKLIDKNNIKFDVVLMDIKMPVMDGIEATRLAVLKYPDIKISALSMYGDEIYLQSMLDAGAIGFMLKNVSRTDLEKALHLLAEGKNYYSEELLYFFTNKYLRKNALGQYDFTKREIEVLELLAKGYSSQQISDKLCISANTVNTHKYSLIDKTGSKNVIDLLLYAIVNKIVIV